MASIAATSMDITSLHRKLMRGEPIVMELAVNGSTYMEPDKYFLLKSSDKVNDLISILQLIEAETINKCEIAYFDSETDELLGEFKANEFIDFYNIKTMK
ncbi:MAG: hypothetical protein ACPGXZ_08625 [Saprospiraceae bacterium]